MPSKNQTRGGSGGRQSSTRMNRPMRRSEDISRDYDERRRARGFESEYDPDSRWSPSRMGSRMENDRSSSGYGHYSGNYPGNYYDNYEPQNRYADRYSEPDDRRRMSGMSENDYDRDDRGFSSRRNEERSRHSFYDGNEDYPSQMGRERTSSHQEEDWESPTTSRRGRSRRNSEYSPYSSQ